MQSEAKPHLRLELVLARPTRRAVFGCMLPHPSLPNVGLVAGPVRMADAVPAACTAKGSDVSCLHWVKAGLARV